MWHMLRKSLGLGVVTEMPEKSAAGHVGRQAGAATAPEVSTLLRELDAKTKRILGRSLHIRHVDTGSCNGCDFEMNAMLNPIYDIQRLGFDFVASPRHADLLMVTGPVTHNLRQALLRAVDATPKPRLVMALGDCACNGGVTAGSYAACGGVAEVVPIDIYVEGCPPTPTDIIRALLIALDRLAA